MNPIYLISIIIIIVIIIIIFIFIKLSNTNDTTSTPKSTAINSASKTAPTATRISTTNRTPTTTRTRTSTTTRTPTTTPAPTTTTIPTTTTTPTTTTIPTTTPVPTTTVNKLVVNPLVVNTPIAVRTIEVFTEPNYHGTKKVYTFESLAGKNFNIGTVYFIDGYSYIYPKSVRASRTGTDWRLSFFDANKLIPYDSISNLLNITERIRGVEYDTRLMLKDVR
jgi:hypothetical protein